MKQQRKLLVIIGILIFTIISLGEVKVKNKEELDKTLLDISYTLGTKYYDNIDTDDEFSKKVLKNYINTLDYNHQYFMQDQVDNLYKKWGTKLDDDFTKGNSEAAFEIYGIYSSAVENVIKYQEKLLESPKKLDFTKDENLIYDREDEPYFKTKKDYENHWRKMLKSSILSIQENEDLTYEESIERMKNRLAIRRKLMKKKTNDDIYSYFVNAFMKEFDPHTSYLSQKSIVDFNISMKLQLSGIGAVLTSEKGYIKVVKVTPDGPAAKGKQLQPEDKIIAIATDGGKFEDVVDWPVGEAVNLIRGKEGTTVKLRVIPSGTKKSKEYTFVRENIKLEDNSAKYFIKSVTLNNKSYKVGVINLPSFYMDFDAYEKGDKDYRSTTRDIKKILEKLNKEKVDGLIMDLRNNGGGSLSEVNSLMGLFIPYGPVVQVKESGKISYLGDSDMKTYFDKPVMVMVNRLSASASEIFAAAMQDTGRGIVVGSPTFGKGTVQTVEKLDLGEIKYTIGKFYRVNGGSTQHKGVIPDILFPPAYDSTKIGESSLDNPLPWDEVKPLMEKNQDPKKISILNQKHIARVKVNPDFIYNQKKYSLIKEMRDEKWISLNREKRKKESNEVEKKWLDIANEKLKGNGKVELKDYKALEDYNKEKAKLDEIDLLKEDGEIIETVKIMVNNIELNKESK